MKKLINPLLFILSFSLFSTIMYSNLQAQTTITYGIWYEEKTNEIRDILSVFEKENPDIKVKLQVTPFSNYWTSLDTSASGKVMPDVSWMNIYGFGRYMVAGVIKDLTPYIKKDNVDMSMYYKSSRDSYAFEGRYYAIPRDVDSIGLWYNKEIFDKAGVDYPNSSWAWEDLENAAKIIKEKVPNIYPIAMSMEGQSDFINLFHQAGGSEIEPDKKTSGFDKPGTITALKWILKLINKEYLPNSKALSTFSAFDSFNSNKAAMMYAGSWRARPISLNSMVNTKVAVTDLPSYKKGGEKVVVSHSIGLVIAQNSKHPDEAWRLIKFITSKRGGKYLAKEGLIIPANKQLKGVWTNSPVFKKANIDVSAHENALSYAIPLDSSLNTSKWQEYELMQLKKVWLGKISPEEFGKLMAKHTNKILKKEQKVLQKFKKELDKEAK